MTDKRGSGRIEKNHGGVAPVRRFRSCCSCTGDSTFVKGRGLTGYLRSSRSSALALGTSLLILGTILLIDGWTALWQAERRDHRAARESAGSGLGAAPSPERATARHAAVPGGDTDTSRRPRRASPDAGASRSPRQRNAPDARKTVYKDARVCRFCGRAFGVTLRLKVYPPADRKKREHVVALLAQN